MTDKEKYRDLCTHENSIPIYSLDWWLDSVCGADQWDVVLYASNDDIEATWPFYLPCPSMTWMPPYTQMLGIWFNPAKENPDYSENLHRKQTICESLIRQLPHFRFFSQNFHYTFSDGLPFHWNGFTQTVRYDYLLPDITQEEKLYNQLNDNLKRNIQKARKRYRLTVQNAVDVDAFLKVHAQTYQRQGLPAYYQETLKKIISVARSRKQGDIWGVFDEKNQLHAAVFIVWQENCGYYVAGGSDREGRQSGAQVLAMWEAICAISSFAQSLDFSGSMEPGIERFFRSFGAMQVPYYTFVKGTRRLRNRLIFRIRKELKQE
ncbi:MAG: GNAT family N-acetyltransferase, partial [Dysgonamonadaceae bacterium]|nr:GNAT family N-acetyltransferase [Dysgonamonadaceae bacterium]